MHFPKLSNIWFVLFKNYLLHLVRSTAHIFFWRHGGVAKHPYWTGHLGHSNSKSGYKMRIVELHSTLLEKDLWMLLVDDTFMFHSHRFHATITPQIAQKRRTNVTLSRQGCRLFAGIGPVADQRWLMRGGPRLTGIC